MDGDGFQDFPTVDPMMLVIDTGVASQPCYCFRPTCEQCYNVSPLTPLGDDAILSSNANSPSERVQMPFGLNSYGPPPGYNMATPAGLSPTALRVPQSTSRPATPVAGQAFVGSPFATGFPTAYQFQAYGALPTPESTIPSNTGDLGRSNTTYCNDFLGNGPKVQLEYDVDYQRPVFELVRNIDGLGFRAHKTNESGQSSAVSALQRSLSFSLTNHTPPIEGQLRINLQNAVQATAAERPLDSITPQDLRRVLNVYEHQTGEHFLLGIIVYDSSSLTYKVSVEMPISGVYTKPIWLFYDKTGSDTGLSNQWSAILPENATRPSSYAMAARSTVLAVRPAAPQQRQQQQQQQQQRRDPRYLAPPFYPTPPRGSTPVGGHPRPHSPNAVRHRRNLSRPGHHGQGGPIPAQHPRNSPRASVEPGGGSGGNACPNCHRGFPTSSELAHHMRKYDNADRPHRCWCGRAFKYPKDLKRHQTSHSSEKAWRCLHCEKAFTRKDNLQRHVKDEHARQ